MNIQFVLIFKNFVVQVIPKFLQYIDFLRNDFMNPPKKNNHFFNSHKMAQMKINEFTVYSIHVKVLKTLNVICCKINIFFLY